MVLDKLFEGPLVAGDIAHNKQIPYRPDAPIPKKIKDLPERRRILQAEAATIQEAKEKAQEPTVFSDRMNEKGSLDLDKHINPLGNPSSIEIITRGDVHFPIAELDRDPTVRFGWINLIRKISPRNILEHIRKGEDWYTGARPRRFAESAWAFAESALAFYRSKKGELSPMAIVSLGDRGYDGEAMTDTAYTFLTQHEMHKVLQKGIRDRIPKNEKGMPKFLEVELPGNHEVDNKFNRVGLERAGFEAELFGYTGFYQEVGRNVVVLGLDTNFMNKAWLERTKQYLLVESRKPLSDLNQEYRKYYEYVRQAMRVQNELIKKALTSERTIILMGHDEKLLQTMPRYELAEVSPDMQGSIDDGDSMLDLSDSKVSYIVAGDLHMKTHEPLKDQKGNQVKNRDNNPIQLIRVGSPIGGGMGWEIDMPPAAYSLHINDDVTVIHEIPLAPKMKEIQQLN